tara:strand:+ start:330 stop:1367 length:1038 start_codon:yes stop_codon:yes gene_type:complete
MDTNNLLTIFVFFIAYFLFFKKFKILNDEVDSSNHKKLVVNYKTNPILLGGVYLTTVFMFFSSESIFPVKITIALIFLLGLSSDKNFLLNPKIRLLLQLIILFSLIFFEDLRVNDLRINVLNNLLSNYHFSLIFTIFCFGVLINGCNFIDGLNGLLIGYSIFIFFSLLIQSGNYSFEVYDINFIYLFICALIILFVFNISGVIFLGDNGSYVLSTILGFYLLDLFINNQFLSPYYIAILLWYPAFENLYSLIRRINLRQNVSVADNAHIHHFVYRYIIDKEFINRKYANSISTIAILIFNVPSFILANIYSTNTKILISLIFSNIIIYLFVYYFLFKYFKFKKKS